MKKFILSLKNDRHVYIFAVFGLLLVIFPAHVAGFVPFVLGGALLLYAAINIIVSLKYKEDARTSLGNGIVKAVTGVIILTMKRNSVSILGVIWAVQSLNEIAKEIDEFYLFKKRNLISLISIIVSLVLAALLMMNPFEHFNMHIRILGLEMISTVFVGRKEARKEV